ncbi:hypothetical protein [Sphingomonas bacterium]|uniref:hypothetical protein n=1 Tax=Sphingomonas bacterium TaxID=1895847 RepID=UPI00260DF83C|nr:hypothetical protein [Sphingomonas bacterium]MDB5678742.1 hypothetical protein [Sphingomonas bacterium]
MTSPTNPFGRLTAVAFDTWRLSLQVTETMVASQAVIGARMRMLGAGMGDSRKIPFAEFGRLIPEKTSAFGKANAGASRALAGKHAVTDLKAALIDDGMTMLDWWERSLSVASAWWLPIHAQATANARRLSA